MLVARERMSSSETKHRCSLHCARSESTPPPPPPCGLTQTARYTTLDQFSTESETVARLELLLSTFAAHNPALGYCQVRLVRLWQPLRLARHGIPLLAPAFQAVDTSYRGCKICSQGMNYVGGLVVLSLADDEAAFWLFNHVLKLVGDFYEMGIPGTLRAVDLLGLLMNAECPTVVALLEREGISLLQLTSQWFLCAFAHDTIPLVVTRAIWDWFLLDGPTVLCQVATAVFCLAEADLLAMDAEGLFHFPQAIPAAVLQPGVLLPRAFAVDAGPTKQ